jgi:hypothetical protein
MKKLQMGRRLVILGLGLVCGAGCWRDACAQEPAAEKQKVIFDTDIGDDVDDAFALALTVASPK